MLNGIWLGLILLGVLIGGFRHTMQEAAEGAIGGRGRPSRSPSAWSASWRSGWA